MVVIATTAMFQFTRPRGARRVGDAGQGRGSCFNSRAHGGRDRTRPKAVLDAQVSIHAPTGGATADRIGLRGRKRVSIHAPTGGATRAPRIVACAHAFQFTRPRGARQSRPRTRHWRAGFNSRAHGGRDAVRTGRGDGALRFNSRAHGGRDRSPRRRRRVPDRFNSRAHGGRDKRTAGTSVPRGVSIHAPTGGATCGRGLVASRQSGFNSRAHGGRDTYMLLESRMCRFQFTRPRGARRSLGTN